MTTVDNTPDASGAIIPQSADATTWDDTYQERPFGPGGGSGNQWEDWGGVMRLAISPPMQGLEDVLLRTPVDDPLDKAEVSALWPLMLEQISCPAGHYNLELRFLHAEMRVITEVLTATSEKVKENELLVLDPKDWAEFGAVFYQVPPTREECHTRLDDIRQQVRTLHELIARAKAGGVHYDVCDLIDWFATPPERRTSNSPSHTLPFFGKILFGVLGLAAQNTAWAHVEAVTSRQIAPRFGGKYDENEKTRHLNTLPGVGDGSPGVASNAPRG